MPSEHQTTYDLIWNQENQFAYRVARQVLEKPTISVWIVLIPILFLYYAHKIQQYKAAVHDFSKGLMRSKILALDAAMEEIDSGRPNEDYKEAFVSGDQDGSPNVMRVREKQIAEVVLLKAHYKNLLLQQGASYQALIKKTYKNIAAYRTFLHKLTRAEEEVYDAVLRAYHPAKEAQSVTKSMQKAALAQREADLKTFFG